MSQRNKKLYSSRTARRHSRQMDSAMLGSHATRGASSRNGRSSRHSQDVGFSSPQRQRRATRGMVDNVANPTSGESRAAYERRMNRRTQAQQAQKFSGVKRIALVIALLLVVVAVAFFVGSKAFHAVVDGKMKVQDEALLASLSAPEDGQPYYVLMCADLDDTNGSNDDVDAALVARIDESTPAVTLLNIPSNTQVTLSDGQTHDIADVMQFGGKADLVASVEALLDVSISHYAQVDAAGIDALMNDMGGMTLTLSEPVDDPAAGSTYLAAGEQMLDKVGALTFLRAANFSGGYKTQALNRAMFLESMLGTYLAKDGMALATSLDGIAKNFKTDWNTQQLIDLAGKLRALDASAVQVGVIPGNAYDQDGHKAYYVNNAELTATMERVEAGQTPEIPEDQQINLVDPSTVSVTVRNGAGITGGAVMVADTLKAAGFKIKETGNTDNFVYDETLVIYKDDKKKDAADTVASSMPAGRVVASNGYYTFKGDVLVILGNDWAPEES